MFERYLCAKWDEPPDELRFSTPFGVLLRDVEQILRLLRAESNDATFEHRQAELLRLYVRAQAIPSLLLNYKICIEFGLPLHPCRYIQFGDEEKDPGRYSPQEKEAACQLFVDAIALCRAIYALSPESLGRLSRLRAAVPPFLLSFEFLNSKDKYTWMASEPRLVVALAGRVKQEIGGVRLVVGAAHGSIRAGILLANLLGCDLYFVRCSLFKRQDERPIVSPCDAAFLAAYREEHVLLFDEDVAKGQTLRQMVTELGPLFRHAASASVLRHYLAPFCPDCVGQTLFD